MTKRLRKDVPVAFDYKDIKTLLRFIDPYGQIEPIGKTGLTAKQQRQLAREIKTCASFGADAVRIARVTVEKFFSA